MNHLLSLNNEPHSWNSVSYQQSRGSLRSRVKYVTCARSRGCEKFTHKSLRSLSGSPLSCVWYPEVHLRETRTRERSALKDRMELLLRIFLDFISEPYRMIIKPFFPPDGHCAKTPSRFLPPTSSLIATPINQINFNWSVHWVSCYLNFYQVMCNLIEEYCRILLLEKMTVDMIDEECN